MDVERSMREAVGLIDPKSAVFVKQYGERRTGSNALRALVMHNYTNMFVLMHILGDKHSPPVDLEALYRTVRHSPDASWRFTWAATHATPAETTHAGNYLQARFLKALHESILEAFVDGRFYRVISVRQPYDWAAALLNYQGWPASMQPGMWEHQAAAALLDEACEAFNRRHEAWLTMHDAHRPRSFIVHAERLRRAWSDVLQELARGMALVPRYAEIESITRSVRPSPWDYIRSKANDEWLDFTAPRTVFTLTEPLHDLVTRKIDWSLMAALGYLPQPFDEVRPAGVDASHAVSA